MRRLPRRGVSGVYRWTPYTRDKAVGRAGIRPARLDSVSPPRVNPGRGMPTNRRIPVPATCRNRPEQARRRLRASRSAVNVPGWAPGPAGVPWRSAGVYGPCTAVNAVRQGPYTSRLRDGMHGSMRRAACLAGAPVNRPTSRSNPGRPCPARVAVTMSRGDRPA